MASCFIEHSNFRYKNSISSQSLVQHLHDLFHELKSNKAEADVSEIIDLNKYKIERNFLKSGTLLSRRFDKSFIFLHCLN